MSDLVNRLRGIYTVPVNDGAGLLNGKDTFTRTFEVPPILKEAAAEIERLQSEITRLQSIGDAVVVPREPTEAMIDFHLNKVLYASGSALRHYSMARVLEAMRKAMREAMLAEVERSTSAPIPDQVAEQIKRISP